jgi:hypothetical protein
MITSAAVPAPPIASSACHRADTPRHRTMPRPWRWIFVESQLCGTHHWGLSLEHCVRRDHFVPKFLRTVLRLVDRPTRECRHRRSRGFRAAASDHRTHYAGT